MVAPQQTQFEVAMIAGGQLHRAAGGMIAALAIAGAAPAGAQQTESLAEPIGVATGDAHPEADVVLHKRKYAFPDLPPLKPPSPEKQARFFNIRPTLAAIGDWTNFHQDATSLGQFGEQQDQFQVRSMRLKLVGSIGNGYKVGFQVGGEYKGFDTEPEQMWQLTDLALTFPLGDRTKLTIGKTKETFSYERVGDAANMPHSERVLNPFFVSRNMGARITHVLGREKRATLSYGLYNDGWDINSATSRGWDISARVTMLVWDVPAANQFLHLGVAYRHVASDGTLRYNGRVETNVGDNFLDTGNIAADSADHFGGEALLNVGPVSLLGEYVTAHVNSPTLKNPRFAGYYLTGSWVLTGETRPYDRNVGYARRVIPRGRWGAPELVLRFSHVDLDSRSVQGGEFDRISTGINWWATTRWKIGVSYGHGWTERFGVRGENDTLLTRLQWIY
jgi:phosphate-selective porin OprO/OprP